MKKKYVILLVVVAVLATIVYAYREYTRKPADLAGVQSQASIVSDSLVAAFEKDEQQANLLYLGKPLDVSGIISEIINQKDTVITIMLGSKDAMHRVSCLVDVNHLDEITRLKAGDNIIIRGICNGFLMDVELNRCVPVK